MFHDTDKNFEMEQELFKNMIKKTLKLILLISWIKKPCLNLESK